MGKTCAFKQAFKVLKGPEFFFNAYTEFKIFPTCIEELFWLKILK